MPMNTISAAGADPMTALAEAMDAAVEAAERAGSTLSAGLPAAGRLLARVIYGSSYALSFGIVFPAALLTATTVAIRPGARRTAVAGETHS
jgi:hypothetical protein